MLLLLAGVLVASCPLVIGELLVRLLGLRKEYARKCIHALGAMAVVSLTLFLDLGQIAGIGLLFSGILTVVRRHTLVKALYEVKRHTYGEIFFPLGVSLAAFFAADVRSFVIAILIMGFADTAASIVGGRSKRKLPGVQGKTFGGSLAFLGIASIFLLFAHTPVLAVAGIACLLTVTEALSPYGSDNATVPMVAVLSIGMIV